MKPSTQGPVIIVDQYQRASEQSVGKQAYKGLAIHALPGLHEYLFSKLVDVVPTGASILDLAAGSGAMSLRLKDAGFRVSSTDYVSDNFRLHGSIPFFRTDLNGQFSAGRESTFDAIIAAEIIEHLENPRHFARECCRLLKPGGVVILSTPNIDSIASIVSHLRHGTFQWFSDADYALEGHITPLSQWQIEKCFIEADFMFIHKGSYGDRKERLRGSPRLMLLARFLDYLSPLSDDLKGQIFIALIQKNTPL